MKKITLILLFALCITTINQAQNLFDKGANVVSLGIGIGGYSPYWGGGYSQSPYFNLAFDHSVYTFPEIKNLSIGVGGYVGYKTISYVFNGSWFDKNNNFHNNSVTERWNYFSLGVRPTIHYTFEGTKFETYAGIPLGYVMVSYSYSDPAFYANSSYGSYFGFGFLAGGRYYFSDKIAAFAELGWGLSYLNIGASFKF